MSATEGIAIIGMAVRFPGADSVESFWQNLRAGAESVSFFSEEELRATGVAPAAIADPRYVRANGVLRDADRFDAAFFGMTPREAEIDRPAASRVPRVRLGSDGARRLRSARRRRRGRRVRRHAGSTPTCSITCCRTARCVESVGA